MFIIFLNILIFNFDVTNTQMQKTEILSSQNAHATRQILSEQLSARNDSTAQPIEKTSSTSLKEVINTARQTKTGHHEPNFSSQNVHTTRQILSEHLNATNDSQEIEEISPTILKEVINTTRRITIETLDFSHPSVFQTTKRHTLITRKDEKTIPEPIRQNIYEPYNSTPFTRYIELLFVLDYQYSERKDQMNDEIEELMKTMNHFYRKLNIYVILVDIVFLTEACVNINPYDLEDTLRSFENYLGHHPIPRRDLSLLLVNTAQLPLFHINAMKFGFSRRNSLCSYGDPALVVLDTVIFEAKIGIHLIHEIGHSIGFEHDEAWCYCSSNECVMNPLVTLMPSVRTWSKCTKLSLMSIFLKKSHWCLDNFPLITTQPSNCGNGLKELEEECDCGTEEDCHLKCCNPSTCKLANRAACGTGKCCDLKTCKVKVKGVECRPSTSCCDLPEYCNGIDEMCPEDVYLNDGHPCRVHEEESVCYQGECRTYNGQCRDIWGKGAKMSHELCFKMGNIQGSFSGHCAYNALNNSFEACRQEDAMCGLLYCETDKEEPKSFGIKSFLMFQLNNTQNGRICRAAIFKDTPRHTGLVRDGVKCGFHSVCLDNKCRRIDEISKPLCKCHKNGICNNAGECYKGATKPRKECMKQISLFEITSKSHKIIVSKLKLLMIYIPLIAVKSYQNKHFYLLTSTNS